MSQKYKTFVLTDKDLSLAGAFSKSSLGEYIENLNVEGSIKTLHTANNIYSIIEPTRDTQLEQVVSETIENICGLFVYQTITEGKTIEYLIICGEDYTLYYYELNSETPSLKVFNSITLSSKPVFQTYVAGGENVLLISSATDSLWTWNGVDEPVEILDSPKVTSMAVNIDRLFVTDSSLPYSVAYSENRDPTTWAMSTGDIATIDFSDDLGKVIKVVALDNYIFVFRQFGIIKIYSGKDSNSFSISKMYFSNGRINANSICQMGDNIAFVASSGLYVFDGLNTKKICSELEGRVDFENCFAVAQNGTYYLFSNEFNQLHATAYFIDIKAGKIFETIGGENFSLAFLLNSDSLNFVGYIDSKNANVPTLIVKNVSIIDENNNFVFESSWIELDPKNKEKTLQKLNVILKGGANVLLLTDKNSRQFEFNGDGEFQSALISEKCSRFKLKIFGSGVVDISNLSLDYCYIEGF
ncbi:MAG: hypothetical protein IJ542_02880 [Clostridia bacterium]|nr:hypothetical protein [Clostridia bacterium]